MRLTETRCKTVRELPVKHQPILKSENTKTYYYKTGAEAEMEDFTTDVTILPTYS